MTSPNAKYTRTLVNPDLISLAHTPHVRVKITGSSYRLHAPNLSKNDDGAITVFPVENLDTGEIGLLMGNTVLENTLAKMEGGYVNKCWEIEASAPRDGQNYRPVKVYQLTEE